MGSSEDSETEGRNRDSIQLNVATWRFVHDLLFVCTKCNIPSSTRDSSWLNCFWEVGLECSRKSVKPTFLPPKSLPPWPESMAFVFSSFHEVNALFKSKAPLVDVCTRRSGCSSSPLDDAKFALNSL